MENLQSEPSSVSEPPPEPKGDDTKAPILYGVSSDRQASSEAKKSAFDSRDTRRNSGDADWNAVFDRVSTTLSAKDRKLFLGSKNQLPLTSKQMSDAMQPLVEHYTGHGFHQFMCTLDPLLSHINSFAGVVNVFVQSYPGIPGLIWGTLYLVITLAGRAQRTLALVLEILWRVSKDMALFQSWCHLFPDKDFGVLNDSVQKVYEEVIRFFIAAVRFLRRHPAVNYFRSFVYVGMESEFQKHEEQIHKLTERVRLEVESAKMHSVDHKLSSIGSIVEACSVQLSSIGSVLGTSSAIKTVSTDLPHMFMIPQERNWRFYGRLSTLERMETALEPTSSRRQQRRFALYGSAGSGKTQIALEYTYLHAGSYNTIIWIVADIPEKVDQAFRGIAEQFGLDPEACRDPLQAQDFVLSRLASATTSYLLVLDNVSDLSLTRGITPRTNRGAVIFTTRDLSLSEEIASHHSEVTEFTTDEGCNFLTHSLRSSFLTINRDKARQISAMFHGFPLALGVIAGYIRSKGCSLDDFINICQKRTPRFLEFAIHDYHANLNNVWDISLASLDENARTILEVFALLDPDSLPHHFFTRGGITQHDHMPRLRFLADQESFLAALGRLTSQSLIRSNRELRTMSIHRYLQARVLDRLSKDVKQQQAVFSEALHLLNIVQPEFQNHSQHWSPQNWQGSEKYLPHIKSLERHFLRDQNRYKESQIKVAALIFQSAVYQFECNHYEAALQSMSNAISIARTGDPVDFCLLSDCYRVQGRIFNESNQPHQTLESSKCAKIYADMAVEKGTVDVNDGRIPRILTGWANALSQLGHLDESLNLQLEAIEHCRKIAHAKSDASAIVQLNWGYLLLRRCDFENAERVLLNALEMDAGAPWIFYPLGNTYLAQGRVDLALATHVSALDAYVSRFGPRMAVVADSYYKIGEILFKHKGRADRAYPLLRRALEIYEFQSRHYDNRAARARCSWMMAKVLGQCEGQQQRRLTYLEKALTLREQLTGVRGSTNDDDEDYVRLLFYWTH